MVGVGSVLPSEEEEQESSSPKRHLTPEVPWFQTLENQSAWTVVMRRERRRKKRSCWKGKRMMYIEACECWMEMKRRKTNSQTDQGILPVSSLKRRYE